MYSDESTAGTVTILNSMHYSCKYFSNTYCRISNYSLNVIPEENNSAYCNAGKF